ncbi:MAG: L,D-transpeptidase family protein [bacterium]
MRKILMISILFFLLPHLASAAVLALPEVKIWQNNTLTSTFKPFSYRGAFASSVAIANFDLSGSPYVVTAAGSGQEPLVSINKIDGTKINQYYAFPKSSKQGLNLTVGDLWGDGGQSIIVAPALGGKSVIRIFKNPPLKTSQSPALLKPDREFTVFEDTFLGGVSLAVFDVDRDGRDELLVGSGPGRVGEILALNQEGEIKMSLKPFGEDYTGGVVANAFLNPWNTAQLIAGQMSQGSRIRFFSISNLNNPFQEISTFDFGYSGGINFTSSDIDNDQSSEIIVAKNGGGSEIQIYTSYGRLISELKVADNDYKGGLALASFKATFPSPGMIVTVPKAPLFDETRSEKLIEIMLDEQRLYAWNNGYLERTFLISSGARGYGTPPGNYSVLRKPLYVNYTRIYGQNDPRNYSFPNTKYNLMFLPHYYLHYAYWHNNFGATMSHGCVNINFDNSEWLYNWAEIGTPVRVLSSQNSLVAKK